MYLVAGATGTVGSEVARQLAAAGEPVRGLTRSGRGVPDGVEAAVGDLDRPATLRPHLDGARGLFLLAGYAGEAEVLAAARESGVERIVLLSGSGAASGDESNAVAAYHIAAERRVRDSGMQWTFLRPNSFMANVRLWGPPFRDGQVVPRPFPDIAVAMIDPADIGAVAVAALTGPGHAGQLYRLSGPEALLPVEQVRIVSETLGVDLRCDEQDDDAARADMLASMPAPYVDAFFQFFRGGLADETTVHPTVQAVLGRPPRTLAQWTTEHRDEL